MLKAVGISAVPVSIYSGDPNYVRELGILAQTIMKRYARRPAVVAIGYNTEIGNGFMSYSEADRQRFIAWLKKKYGTVEELNRLGQHSAGRAA